MHASFYMLEKELIEHKMVTRLPLFLLACVLFAFFSFISSSDLQTNFSYHIEYQGDFAQLPLNFANDIHQIITFVFGLISLLLTTIYIPKTLRKERNEGSAMFWRSMPISPFMTHCIKLGFGLFIIPLICSLVVLCANLCMWIINLTAEQPLMVLANYQSLLQVFGLWLIFVIKMWCVGLALLPLACFTLMLSQAMNAPILAMTIGGYALSWISIAVFHNHLISGFLSRIVNLPYKLLLQSNIMTTLMNTGLLTLLLYVVIGGVSFLLSLQLYKTNEVSWKALFSH